MQGVAQNDTQFRRNLAAGAAVQAHHGGPASPTAVPDPKYLAGGEETVLTRSFRENHSSKEKTEKQTLPACACRVGANSLQALLQYNEGPSRMRHGSSPICRLAPTRPTASLPTSAAFPQVCHSAACYHTGMFRTRIAKHIVAEFLPPVRAARKEKLVILCDGMPSMPRKQTLAAFLAGKGYWVVYPRYRGAWESHGVFLARSPHLDILDVIDELPEGLTDLAFGRRYKPKPEHIYVIGGSFGGPSAILCSLDPRVTRVIANCPVVDWSILKSSERAETSNPDYVEYIRGAFGNGYRLTTKNWNKLRTGTFYNPMHHVHDVEAKKIMMFHAQDDPYVPWRTVARFAKLSGARLNLFKRGGHISTDGTIQKYWPMISRFFISAR